jgi:hypothetical protein
MTWGSTHDGGKGVYWQEPDGRIWEMLTISYAAPPPRSGLRPKPEHQEDQSKRGRQERELTAARN